MIFQKILVAIDNSHLCQSVFAAALELARVHRGRLMLLHCLGSETIGEPPVPIAPEIGLYPQILETGYPANNVVIEQRIQEAQAMLLSYCETATSSGVETVFDRQVGEAGPLLCQVAANWNADLIVLGRRGRKGLTEALLGSVSNYVLHHAPCSVLVIQDAKHKAS